MQIPAWRVDNVDMFPLNTSVLGFIVKGTDPYINTKECAMTPGSCNAATYVSPELTSGIHT